MTSKKQPKTLRLILGDQLNHDHSWYQSKGDHIIYVLMEVASETSYVKHHIQKLIAFFLAMRAFAKALQERGHNVRYLRLDDPGNLQDIPSNLAEIIQELGIEKLEYQMPDEYRLDQIMADFCESLSIPYEVFDTEHFLTTRNELESHFKGKKTYLMESFYRMMRRKYEVLMEGDQPEGGKWNYDQKNRNRYDGEVQVPDISWAARDVSDLYEMVRKQEVSFIGELDPNKFRWAVTRKEGLAWLEDFIENRLPHFGTYQDALAKDEAFLFHSCLSFLMNVKLLHPLEVIQAAEKAWKEDPDRISLHQVEGFIRQILGWREYMRGIYWAKMPEFSGMNFFSHDRKLPGWFWTGKTRMQCLKKSIDQSLKYAYAHHIQRLMITGNFALLAGVHPDEVDAWYLGIYIDALDWVEITNTRGMSQFADGGIIGTKPYVSSATYINKMGDYCKGCHYSQSVRTGPGACPFNSLYWHFHDRNRELLENNPRIGMTYRTWDKMNEGKKKELLDQADFYLEHIESL